MEFDLNLIKLVQQNECIYNVKKLDYRNNIKKKQIWAHIAEKLRSKPDICAKRWKSIRRRYIDDLKESKGSQSGSGVKKKRTWPLLKHLEFLGPHLSSLQTETSISSSCFLNQEELIEHDYDFEPKFSAQTCKSVEEVFVTELHDENPMDYKELDIQEEEEEEEIPITYKQLQGGESPRIDSTRHFLLSLEEPLRKLPYIAQMKTRKLLMNVIIDQIQENGIQ